VRRTFYRQWRNNTHRDLQEESAALVEIVLVTVAAIAETSNERGEGENRGGRFVGGACRS
jgi:hypothetical protein